MVFDGYIKKFCKSSRYFYDRPKQVKYLIVTVENLLNADINKWNLFKI